MSTGDRYARRPPPGQGPTRTSRAPRTEFRQDRRYSLVSTVDGRGLAAGSDYSNTRCSGVLCCAGVGSPWRSRHGTRSAVPAAVWARPGTVPCRFALGADPGQPARNLGQREARRRLAPGSLRPGRPRSGHDGVPGGEGGSAGRRRETAELVAATPARTTAAAMATMRSSLT